MRGGLPIIGQLEPTRPELKTVRALEALWAEVSHKPLWAPPNFWRYLRLRWRARLKLLDPARVRIFAHAGKVNDCGSCLDICCVGPRSTVLLRFKDIATLIDLGRTDLMTTEKPSFTSDEIAERPALERHVQSRSWATFPVLVQNSYGACAALSDEGKCSLYPDWPLSCARFPYSLHADDEEIFYSRRCDAFWIRPDARDHQSKMALQAVEAYNERIKDLVLLEYAPERLESLGVLKYLAKKRN